MYYAWVGSYLFATFFMIGWDTYMDFGLLRTREKGKYGLRPKLMYATYFYYIAIFLNIIFRF